MLTEINDKEKNEKPIEIEDVRSSNLSERDFSGVPINTMKRMNFDTQTIWPEKDKMPSDFVPEKTLEENKNPGLGIRELHEQGITGQGVVVAIIDQKIDVNHPEYKSSLIVNVEYATAKEEKISAHGPAVASLLVGKDCGVASGAKLVYKGVPSGRNFSNQVQALEDILEKNETVLPEEKVRIVSCSIGYELKNPEPGLDEWVRSLKKAKDAGVFVVDVSGDQIGVLFSGGGSPDSKDDFESYLPWSSSKGVNAKKHYEIVIPSDYRTVASSWHKESQYAYYGKGGQSWAVPYLSGILALLLQVNPNLKSEEISEIINESAVVNTKGLRIINPKGAIDLATRKINKITSLR